jgi:hypothetical protein
LDAGRRGQHCKPVACRRNGRRASDRRQPPMTLRIQACANSRSTTSQHSFDEPGQDLRCDTLKAQPVVRITDLKREPGEIPGLPRSGKQERPPSSCSTGLDVRAWEATASSSEQRACESEDLPVSSTASAAFEGEATMTFIRHIRYNASESCPPNAPGS